IPADSALPGKRRGYTSLFLAEVDLHPLSEEPIMSTALRKKMHQDLQLAGLSEGTQDVYLRVVRKLAVHFDTPPDVLNEAQVRDYLLHLKNEKKLPDVLSIDEVRELIGAVRKLRYRTYFSTVYSLGLRRNEGLHLQV